MKRFETVSDLARAIREGEVPTRVISPGAAAAILGVTRQAIWKRIKGGSLPAWGAEGMWFVDVDPVAELRGWTVSRVDKVNRKRQSARR